MAVFDPGRTAAVAEAAVRDRMATAKNRILPVKLKVLQGLMEKKIHVFNVGPWPQVLATGSTGTFYMPACPPDKEYVELLVSDGRGNLIAPISEYMEEYVIKSEDEMTALAEDGRAFAHAMLGEGRGQSPANSLLHFGLFVAEGETPTKAEIASAKELLKARCAKIYKEASDLYATDRKLFSRVVKAEYHFVAARILGRDNPQDSPWMLDAAPVGRVKCEMCGRVVDPGVAMCEGGHIVDHEAYIVAMERQQATLAAAAAVKSPPAQTAKRG